MRRASIVPVVLLVAGAGLVTVAVLAGGASVSLLLIVPVVTGRSAEFLLGVVLLLAGLFLLPWLWAGEVEEAPPLESEAVRGPAGNSSVGGGGVVLIGPVPIFFGGWRHLPRRARVAVALVGGVVLVVLTLAVLGVF